MSNQKGAALIVVLSLLTVALILGLSGMQSSQLDERLAGNYRSQSKVQMGAEEAASAGFETLQSGSNSGFTFSAPSFSSNFFEIAWDEFAADSNFAGDSWVEYDCESVQCYYRFVKHSTDYYIISMAKIDNNNALSSPVYVYLDVDEWNGFGPPSAVTLPGGIDEDISNDALQWPKSAKSKISGGDGFEDSDGNQIDVAAMSILQGDGLLNIESAYEDKADLNSDTVLGLDQEPTGFVSVIKKMYDEYAGGSGYSGVHFYTGDEQMDFTGNNSLSGLHIVLNGSVQIGGNSHLDGALIVLNVNDIDADSWELSPATFVKLNGGGGDGTVWFNSTNVSNALEEFGLTLDDFYGISVEDNLFSGVAGIDGWF
ncbi:PilX N-terminal domain-containing pilus assembly protein [Halomonas sp. 11-S5]|uniref:pilus assembly PilX family protein n=1 Tax=Halomonas sp. 11-S5 TaxID=2994064 RepID=UPI002469A87D|nr:PilX N-terminal domain-containing pilus assembly protein [Halomonas sp. 11-S5]